MTRPRFWRWLYDIFHSFDVASIKIVGYSLEIGFGFVGLIVISDWVKQAMFGGLYLLAGFFVLADVASFLLLMKGWYDFNGDEEL